MAFIKGIGRQSHYFTSSTQDTSNRLLASQFLYGAPLAVPIPDLMRTDLLIMMGSNPFVSHGSFLTAPRIKDRMHDVVKRGGRVVVVDPRKTETAAAFEWLGIVPDGDAYFLLPTPAGAVLRGPCPPRIGGIPGDRRGLAAAALCGISPGSDCSPHRHRAGCGPRARARSRQDPARGRLWALRAPASGKRHADRVSDRRRRILSRASWTSQAAASSARSVCRARSWVRRRWARRCVGAIVVSAPVSVGSER